MKTDNNCISGFWRRAIAFVIDVILLIIILIVLAYFGLDWLARIGPIWGKVISALVIIPYFAILESHLARGRTPGRR